MGRIFDVAVLGGGVAGASMAYVLAGMGWETVLIDRSMMPRHKVCGEFLSPEAQGILAALGLDTLVRALGPSEMHEARLVSADGVTIAVPLPGAAWGVSRHALDRALHVAALAQGADVRTGVTVTAVTPNAGSGWRIETQQQEGRAVIEVRAVIGAWGRSASERLTAVGKDAPHVPSPNKSFVGVKQHYLDLQPPGREKAVELFFFPGGYVGVAPIDAGRLNAAALVTREAFRRASGTVQGVLDDAALHNAALRRRLAHAAPVPGTQAAVAPVLPRRSPAPWGAVPHIGDAAAVIPPLCGDGMAMALRSAQLCAPLAHGYLAGRLSLAEWRQRYTAAVRREFAGPLRWGGLLQDVLLHPALSGLAFRLGAWLPGLSQRLIRASRLPDQHNQPVNLTGRG